MDTFGERVKQIRESLGLTQEDLGKRAGLKASAISHMEAGRRDPRLSTIIRVCEGLGCKIDKLIKVRC